MLLLELRHFWGCYSCFNFIFFLISLLFSNFEQLDLEGNTQDKVNYLIQKLLCNEEKMQLLTNIVAKKYNAQMWSLQVYVTLHICHKLLCAVDLTTYKLTVGSPSAEDKNAIFNRRWSNIELFWALACKVLSRRGWTFGTLFLKMFAIWQSAVYCCFWILEK